MIRRLTGTDDVLFIAVGRVAVLPRAGTWADIQHQLTVLHAGQHWRSRIAAEIFREERQIHDVLLDVHDRERRVQDLQLDSQIREQFEDQFGANIEDMICPGLGLSNQFIEVDFAVVGSQIVQIEFNRRKDAARHARGNLYTGESWGDGSPGCRDWDKEIDFRSGTDTGKEPNLRQIDPILHMVVEVEPVEDIRHVVRLLELPQARSVEAETEIHVDSDRAEDEGPKNRVRQRRHRKRHLEQRRDVENRQMKLE